MEAAKHHRGGSKSSVAEGMLRDIDDAVSNRCPLGHGCGRYRWDTRVLQRYIRDTYDREYSCERIQQVLDDLRYSFKRSAKRPTRAHKEAHRGSSTEGCRIGG